jgi:UPF0716 protein FxsA
LKWRTRALLLAYPLIELITVLLVAGVIGWVWTLALLVIGLPVGLAIMRNAGGAAMADLRDAAASGHEPENQARHALTMLGGLLIAVPGFWTDLLGVLLVLPPTQRLLRSRVGSWVQPRLALIRMPGMSMTGFADGDVIRGTVIRVEDLRQEPPEPPRPLT